VIASSLVAPIKTDPTLSAGLAQYDFGAGNEPAVFAYDSPGQVLPHDVPLPAVLIVPLGGTEQDTRGTKGAALVFQVSLILDKTRERNDDLAQALWKALDKVTLTHADFTVYGALADPPQLTADPEGFPMYVMSVRVFVEAT